MRTSIALSVIVMTAFAAGLFLSVPVYSDQTVDTAFSLLSTSVEPQIILAHKSGYKGHGYRSWYGPGLLFHGGLYGSGYGGYYGGGTGTYQEGNKVCVWSGFEYNCYDSFTGGRLN
ncbi:MAG: hypothetical protein FJ118_00120 [Deltaproteobacteria bacterium]|nr:hypothetical protein [Deltaproteobacteria bacterium]